MERMEKKEGKREIGTALGLEWLQMVAFNHHTQRNPPFTRA